MFFKKSRYLDLADVVTADSYGRSLKSKALRLLPKVTGTFLQIVEEVDRLDHLGYKYYREPRKWWRVCDANPEFMSPQALLGKGPVITTRFPLSLLDSSTQPPWSNLLINLGAHVGVEDVQIADDISVVPEQQTLQGQSVTVFIEQYDLAVVVTYNLMNVSAEDLGNVITASGFVVAQTENIGRVGKNIVIPPDVVG